jgi:sRNA-binding carbon storage regulator CsrA
VVKLARRQGESIILYLLDGQSTWIEVSRVSGRQVFVGINASGEVRILRRHISESGREGAQLWSISRQARAQCAFIRKSANLDPNR